MISDFRPNRVVATKIKWFLGTFQGKILAFCLHFKGSAMVMREMEGLKLNKRQLAFIQLTEFPVNSILKYPTFRVLFLCFYRVVRLLNSKRTD